MASLDDALVYRVATALLCASDHAHSRRRYPGPKVYGRDTFGLQTADEILTAAGVDFSATPKLYSEYVTAAFKLNREDI